MATDAAGLRIEAVGAGTPGERAGLRGGDLLLTINGAPVPDALAYRFHAAGEELHLAWRDGSGAVRTAHVTKSWTEDLGLQVPALGMRACNNRCAFCFAHQNPRGARRALNFKDDDYRHSFLHGNFATLTNLTPADAQRIVAERLSPLYVSVHATEWDLRNRLLGNPKAPNILERIAGFAAGRIHMHCQVVLCPGLNDGAHLERTLGDLEKFHPWVSTVALVPVGLTAHRGRQPQITPPDAAYAADLLDRAAAWRRDCQRRLGTRFVFPSDEFYLLAGRPFPAARAYEGFAQFDNGVGNCRQFLDDFARLARRLPPALPGGGRRRVLAVTGALAAPVLRQAVGRFNGVAGLRVDLLPVANRYFGGTVGCAGLLAGGDIGAAVRERAAGADAILIPAIAAKRDTDLFLDDVTLAALNGDPAVAGRARLVRPTAGALVAAALGGHAKDGAAALGGHAGHGATALEGDACSGDPVRGGHPEHGAALPGDGGGGRGTGW
jgi:putative radical SAM enzyme (TIGR03279 family)